VLTDWDHYRCLDFDDIFRRMIKPAFAFDGRNVLPHDRMRAIGFEVHAIGKPIA
jgi:UDPglucose 6-dehydrogenase